SGEGTARPAACAGGGCGTRRTCQHFTSGPKLGATGGLPARVLPARAGKPPVAPGSAMTGLPSGLGAHLSPSPPGALPAPAETLSETSAAPEGLIGLIARTARRAPNPARDLTRLAGSDVNAEGLG